MLHSPERWKQIEDLFHESLALPAESRSAFLEERCAKDTELCREVEALLDSAGQTMDFLEQPVIDAAHELATGGTANRVSPGQLIDHYEIISFIGAGGMGQVYLAQDTTLKRKVAIKILGPALTNDARGLRRFEQEARAASALNHPNILTIYEFGHVDGLHFIASEYVEGPTLRQKLSRGRLAVSTATDIAIQIARALDAAHSFGIVHRDIKPENVVVRTDQLVKVLDFGIAKLSESQTHQAISSTSLPLSLSISQAGLVVGSARYMSPEQARGQAVDPRSDIFSLGVVLYEMISGQVPFDGQTISDVIADILKGNAKNLDEVLPDVPCELQDIVSRAMRKDREARYQNVKDMLADLQELVSQTQFQAKLLKATAVEQGEPGSLSTAAQNESPARTPTSSTQSRIARRKFYRNEAWLVIPIAVLALAVFGVFFLVLSRRAGTATMQAKSRSLAILPFRNVRDDPTLDYLGFSLSDAIISKLSSVSALTVRPSSSVDKYRNQNVDPRTIGEELNVDTLLTGNFIKDGDDLRITAQLVDLKADKIRWRDSIDVKYDKLLTVQDRVSQEIVKGLELNLSTTEAQNLKPGNPVNPQAYEYYLRGIDLYSLNDFPAAISMLEKSVSLDPNYAPTWAHLGRAYTTNATLRLGGREQYDRAQSAYEKAMALDPNLVEPRIFMANMLTDTGKVEQAVPLLRTALKTNPNNAELHWELGYAYRFAGMLRESLVECQKARQINPEVKINSSAMNTYLYLGEYDKFLQSLPQNDSAYVLFYRGLGEYYENHPTQAAQAFDRAYMLEPSLLPAKVGKALSDSIAGRRAPALDLLHQTEEEMEELGVSDAESMFKIAQAYAVLGNKPAALHALSHTIEGGFFCYPCFVTDPLLANIRNEPESERLMEEARLRHEQFKSRFF
jgi:serine/threonine protein kinase/TolB-like protein/tetratricopeptide (TPR) repeat protein